jgi:hypothetical protein
MVDAWYGNSVSSLILLLCYETSYLILSKKNAMKNKRMATDLNLHRKTATTSQDTPEGHARDKEVHVRERTWLLCFCLDRSFSSQMGKPYSIKEE